MWLRRNGCREGQPHSCFCGLDFPFFLYTVKFSLSLCRCPFFGLLVIESLKGNFTLAFSQLVPAQPGEPYLNLPIHTACLVFSGALLVQSRMYKYIMEVPITSDEKDLVSPCTFSSATSHLLYHKALFPIASYHASAGIVVPAFPYRSTHPGFLPVAA